MLPNWLYEKMPRIYLILGILDVFYFYKPLSTLGLMSGVILIITSLIIFRLRYEWRVIRVGRL